MTDPHSTIPCNALVVGAGPVGLTMAAELARHGVACRIIDRAPQPSDKSRALIIWPRTLELLADMGCVDRFLECGMLLDSANLYAGRQRLMHADVPFTGTSFPRPLTIAQDETERLLTEHLHRLGKEVERPVEMIDVVERGGQVEVRLKHAGDRLEEARCRWLLGCDGAHSAVRKKLGIRFTGEFEPNDWFLADCHINGPIAADSVHIFWHSQGVLAIFPFGDRRFRIIADQGKAPNTAHPPDPTLEQVQRLVDERGPAGLTLSAPIWLSGFRIHERKVGDYRKGSCFLAGDAAHIHSPAGGQGMNTGMQDAWNLAWKLAQVHHGRARPELLDSYNAERERVGEMVLKQAGRLTTLATLRNPVLRFLRNRAFGFLGLLPAFRRAFTYNLSQLGISYPKSPLNAHDGSLGGGIRPGSRVPDLPLFNAQTNQSENLHSLLHGTTWSLLLFANRAENAVLASLGDLAGRIQDRYPETVRVRRIVVSPTLHEGARTEGIWLDQAASTQQLLGARSDSTALLVRPDGYLAYRGVPVRGDRIEAYLSRWLVPAPQPRT